MHLYEQPRTPYTGYMRESVAEFNVTGRKSWSELLHPAKYKAAMCRSPSEMSRRRETEDTGRLSNTQQCHQWEISASGVDG